MRTVFLIAAILFVPAFAHSATLIVPDVFPNIQDAIDAANQGDTVLVKPGTYVENIDFKSKAITVKSEKGTNGTVIDGNQSGSTVTFKNGEGQGSILEGFTICNGSGTRDSSLKYCGGGIYCLGAGPTIRGNVIAGNHVQPYNASFGGGLYCGSASAPLVYDNLFKENQGFFGGGICGENDTSIIKNNLFVMNGSAAGGGIWSYAGSRMIIANNVISCNTASSNGGGISVQVYADPTITNNTVTDNESYYGGGLFSYNNSSPEVMNTILWGNVGTQGKEICLGSDGTYPTALTIGYSDVEGGLAAVHVSAGSTLHWDGGSMIKENPQFVDPDGPDNNPGTWEDNDFHVCSPSPCRDSGRNGAPAIQTVDFEGDPRIAYGTVDMGADEFHTHLYWKGDATPGGSLELKFVGLPGTSPVGFWVAFNVLAYPIPGAYGYWYLLPPMIGPIPLPSIPADGVRVLSGQLPVSPPAPYTLYLQAIMGTPLKLTNLLCMHVQ